MRIIIAPAKKMVVDTDSFAVDSPPQFLEQTEQLKSVLQDMSSKDLQALWKCNDSIAKLNIERLEQMNLYRNLTPAILSYESIQYRYMAPSVMETTHLDYLREHLRILSGFYGLLRPFDGVTPYRLEMQARLTVGGYRDLYQFWGDRLARQLASETGVVLNLASREYSRALEVYLPKTVRFVTCAFGEWKDGKVIEKGTKCKIARGQMVHWLAENQIKSLEDIRAFNQLGYRFQVNLSTKTVVYSSSGRKILTDFHYHRGGGFRDNTALLRRLSYKEQKQCITHQRPFLMIKNETLNIIDHRNSDYKLNHVNLSFYCFWGIDMLSL